MGNQHSSSRSGRGVTPAVAVVLMLAITVLLVVAVVPFVFSVSDNATGGAPTVDFAYRYGENVETDTNDTFDETGASSGGDGIVTILLERGERLKADQIRIEGETSGGVLSDSDAFEVDENVGRGAEITVWAQHGEEIDIIWTSADEKESYILDTLTVRPTVVGLPAGVGSIDYDCDGWSYPSDFDDKDGLSASSGDLTIDGVTLKCDLSKFNLDNVDIVNDGVNIGNVEANSDISIDDGAVYKGSVVAGDKVDISNGAEINGDVEGTSSGVSLDGGSSIDGDVDSGNDFNLQSSSQISGDVVVRSGSTLDTVDSSIMGDVTLKDGSEANDITNSFIGGNINATDGNKVVVNSDSTVGGTIDASGGASVTLNGQSSIDNHVRVDTGSDLICSDGNDSTITGIGCLDYKVANFGVTIDSTNSPVEQGNMHEVTVTVENIGLSDGTQEISLIVDGIERTNQSIGPLGGGAQTTVTLSWDTSGVSTGSYPVVVSSDNDSDSTGVDIKSSVSPEFNSLEVTIDSIKKNGRLDLVTFDYQLNKESTVTLEVVGEDSMSITNTKSGTYSINKLNADFSVTLKADISGGECYKITVSSSVSEGDTFDILSSGTTC